MSLLLHLGSKAVRQQQLHSATTLPLCKRFETFI